MYREERIINGKLMERGSPDGPWREVQGPIADAVNALLILDIHERAQALRHFHAYAVGIQED